MTKLNIYTNKSFGLPLLNLGFSLLVLSLRSNPLEVIWIDGAGSSQVHTHVHVVLFVVGVVPMAGGD